MNDIDEFLEVTGAIYFAVIALVLWLTHLEQSLHASRKPRPPSRPMLTVSAWLRGRGRD